MAIAAATSEVAPFFIELGAIIAGLAVLARVAGLLDVSPIPLYLLAGLALGEGGLTPIGFSEEFVAGVRTSAWCSSSSCSGWSTPARS